MFTVEQIKQAHTLVRSGADFPAYIRELRKLGVIAYETFVKDSHTCYFGDNNFQVVAPAMYGPLSIAESPDTSRFTAQLKQHQAGQTDYYSFCKDCAAAGIEKWIVSLVEMTCTYFDKQERPVLVEQVPA